MREATKLANRALLVLSPAFDYGDGGSRTGGATQWELLGTFWEPEGASPLQSGPQSLDHFNHPLSDHRRGRTLKL